MTCKVLSPGRHVPVISWADAESRKLPDYMIVLAWNFADAIIANHRKYLEAGGHFIVPLPEIRIV